MKIIEIETIFACYCKYFRQHLCQKQALGNVITSWCCVLSHTVLFVLCNWFIWFVLSHLLCFFFIQPLFFQDFPIEILNHIFEGVKTVHKTCQIETNNIHKLKTIRNVTKKKQAYYLKLCIRSVDRWRENVHQEVNSP